MDQKKFIFNNTVFLCSAIQLFGTWSKRNRKEIANTDGHKQSKARKISANTGGATGCIKKNKNVQPREKTTGNEVRCNCSEPNGK